MAVDLEAWANAIRFKQNRYMTPGEFAAELDLDHITTHAEGQLVQKLSVGGFQLSRQAWNALTTGTKLRVARELATAIGNHQWLIRSVAGTVVAVLGNDYTIVDHSVVAEAVAKCGIPCENVYPINPGVEVTTAYFRLVDRDQRYQVNGKEMFLSVNVRNSEVGTSAVGADVGVARVVPSGTYYMWSKDRVGVDSCIRHVARDPDEVLAVIQDILAEAPQIAETHVDIINAARDNLWYGFDEGADKVWPKYVIEQVELSNPVSVADVYLALCAALRDMENAENRRRLERQALVVLTGDKFATSRGRTTVVSTKACPLCGHEVEDK